LKSIGSNLYWRALQAVSFGPLRDTNLIVAVFGSIFPGIVISSEPMMNSRSAFSYRCNGCGRCCHNQVITLSPYDLIRLARAANLSTAEAARRFTSRRGSLLRFNPDGACLALDGIRCGLHAGRPLACRLYPLGLQREGPREPFMRLEPADGSAGIYSVSSTVAAFLESQGVSSYLKAIEQYHALLAPMRNRIGSLVNFDSVEPREFWRGAFNEAMRESGYDSNPIIDMIFDPDSVVAPDEYVSEPDLIAIHVTRVRDLIERERDGGTIAAAAMLLAVSLGYSPADVIASGGIGGRRLAI
jgi:Fe-S-cluster containining protein